MLREYAAAAVMAALSLGLASGYRCLWDCPPIAAAPEASHCGLQEAGTPGEFIGGWHDCADHRVESAPTTLATRGWFSTSGSPAVPSDGPQESVRSAPGALVLRPPASTPVRFIAPLRL